MLNYDCAFSLLVLPPGPGLAAVVIHTSEKRLDRMEGCDPPLENFPRLTSVL